MWEGNLQLKTQGKTPTLTKRARRIVFKCLFEEDAGLGYFQRSNRSQFLVKNLLTAQVMCYIIHLQCRQVS